jgi:hypothetical protein
LKEKRAVANVQFDGFWSDPETPLWRQCDTSCSCNFSNPRAQMLMHLANIIADVAG